MGLGRGGDEGEGQRGSRCLSALPGGSHRGGPQSSENVGVWSQGLWGEAPGAWLWFLVQPVRPVLYPPLQSVLQQPAQQALLLDRPRATSILSCLTDSDLQGPGVRSRSQELPEMDSFSSEDPRDTETSTSASTSDVGFLPLAVGPNTSIEEEAQEDPPPLGLLPEMFHLVGGSFVEQPGWRNLGVESPDLPRGSPFDNHRVPGSQEGHVEGDTQDGVDGLRVPLERPLQEVLDLLRSTDPAPPQLRELEYQVLSFRDRLKVWALFAGQKPCFADNVTTGSGP